MLRILEVLPHLLSVWRFFFNLLGLQSRFRNKPVEVVVVCPPNGTAVLTGSSPLFLGLHILSTGSIRIVRDNYKCRKKKGDDFL